MSIDRQAERRSWKSQRLLLRFSGRIPKYAYFEFLRRIQDDMRVNVTISAYVGLCVTRCTRVQSSNEYPVLAYRLICAGLALPA